jgi:Tfp pilus assembly protein PilO
MKTVLAVLSVILLAGAFWLILLAPKREKAYELSEEATAISAELASASSQLAAAKRAKENFGSLYSKLTLIGKAVPSESGTSSLVVQLQGIANRSKTSFVTIEFGAEGGGESAEPSAPAGSSTPRLPIGAVVGPAGLPAMPYTLKFGGNYFEIARFIKELDSLVKTDNEGVDANGRLVLIDGFTIEPEEEEEAGAAAGPLKATFQVTTYVAPPNEGLTAGATAAGPESVEASIETTEVGATP